MQVSEIYAGLIQKGFDAGVPATFVINKGGVRITNDEISGEVSRLPPFRVVFSGEPLVEQIEIFHLLMGLRQAGHIIEIETHGEIMPDSMIRNCVDRWSVYPDINKKQFPDSMMFFARNENARFYFNVKNFFQLGEIHAFVEYFGINPRNVMVFFAKNPTGVLTKMIFKCIEEGYALGQELPKGAMVKWTIQTKMTSQK